MMSPNTLKGLRLLKRRHDVTHPGYFNRLDPHPRVARYASNPGL